ncbi:MAG: 4-hydroxy-tetrahydrodipicolinate reductase [Verrucomicrobiaceae bacterium]|jgi:4-hydroxy-tetrahydrodipicolinate reductase|nr:4-hydroxy-tetrahydrodipicolinate reductase [Verrucomicrobiaceae bacterium]
MVKVLLNGAKGRMGQAITAAASLEGCEIFAGCDIGDNPADFIADCDVVIDFSFRDITAPLAKLCAEHKKPLIIGTTGHTAQQREEILQYTKDIAIVWAGNYSLGVNLLNYLTKVAAEILNDSYDVEIVEMHHRHKKDSPSGTAEKLKQVVLQARGIDEDSVVYGRKGLVGERPQGEVAVHALRGGSVVGDHTVMFATDGERLELTHKAADRKVFANGALRASKWVLDKPAGLYGMDDVLNLK